MGVFAEALGYYDGLAKQGRITGYRVYGSTSRQAGMLVVEGDVGELAKIQTAAPRPWAAPLGGGPPGRGPPDVNRCHPPRRPAGPAPQPAGRPLGGPRRLGGVRGPPPFSVSFPAPHPVRLVKIVDVDVLDVRFPTSRTLDGSGRDEPRPRLLGGLRRPAHRPTGLDGHGLTFTIGRGTEVVVAAIRSLRPFVVGRDAEELFGDMRAFWRQVTGDSQLRWIGPEKGAIHLATAAVVNAVWDLWAKVEGKPLWKLLADMTPRQLVDVVDFRYITDALTPDEALRSC